MENKRILLLLVFIFLGLFPTVLASCAPGVLYCDNSYQDILKCDDQGNNKYVFEECSLGCELTSERPICKEHLVKLNTASSFLSIGIIVLFALVALIIYIKRKRKV